MSLLQLSCDFFTAWLGDWKTDVLALIVTLAIASSLPAAEPPTIRFATYNVSLYAQRAGEVAERLATGDDLQAQAEAEIIQRVRPDVLLLNEVDYEPEGKLIETFQKKYLEVGQNVSESPEGPAQPIQYKYRYFAPSNTGMHSGHDLDRNGRLTDKPGSVDYGADCWGFGQYPGQYGMVILSKYPILAEQIRTFKNFAWQDMPDALLPDNLSTPEPADWYSPEALEKFPLSSKSHWDVPIQIGERIVHVLTSHPTPPAFDGEEDRNGRRNHDEIRFWVDYISLTGAQSADQHYIYDDAGKHGGLPAGESFVIMGDLNGDSHDGQGQIGIAKLLAAPELANYPAPESDGGEEQAKLQGGINDSHQGRPRQDTLDAADENGPGNLRLDYVLPSNDLKVVASAVFWPQNTDTLFKLVGTFPFPSSDHRLVWVDVSLPSEP
ncbi:MAG: endonuclease/exonuclease/phosphatase family protein [Bythopirellula sp.]|nr:endonuclease/exonuclease/phosphatase family protein [Bythopirellula sp.]